MGLALFGSLAWALDNLPPHSKATTFAAILCGLLLVALLAIYSLIKQNADHDRQQDGGTQNNQIIPLLNAVITETRAYHRQRNRHEQNKQFRDWVTIAALVGAGIFAAMQWVEMSAVYKPISDQAGAAHDTMIASSRAWVGPIDALIVTMKAGEGIKIDVSYGNSGRQPALTVESVNPKVYSAADWNGGTAVRDILEFETKCMKSDMVDIIAHVVYPNVNPNSFFVPHFDSTNDMLAENIKFTASNDLAVTGKELFALMGCFIYRTVTTVHHSAFCYRYNAKAPGLPHLNFCTVGQNAD